MQERLRKINEDIEAVIELKNELDQRNPKTQNDLEELEIIQNWFDELYEKLSYLKKETVIDESIIEETIESTKTIREQFDENRIKINEIKYHSKSLQPKFTSSNKRNKNEVLKSLGFVETTTVDNRSILIHPTLVGQYYDLVKEQKRLSEKLKEEYKKENQPKSKKKEIIINNEQLQELIEVENLAEEEIENQKNELQSKFEKNQQELAKIMEGKGLGKKDYIKHNGIKYWIPKKYVNRFRALMHEQELLSKELGIFEDRIEEQNITNSEINIEIQEPSAVEQQSENVIFEEIEKNLKKSLENLEEEIKKETDNNNQTKNIEPLLLPILCEEVKKTRKSLNLKNKIKHAKNLIIGTIIYKLKNTSIYKKYKEKHKKIKVPNNSTKYESNLGLSAENVTTEEEIKNDKEKRKNKLEKNLTAISLSIDELKNKENRTESEEKDLEKLLKLKEETENELNDLNEKPINSWIKNRRKSKTDLKSKKKKNLKKILLRLTISAGLTLMLLAGIKSCNATHIEQPVTTETEYDNETENKEKEDEEKVKENKQESDLEFFIDNKEKEIDNNKIYENMYDADKKENAKSTYFENESKGTIVGWGVKLNDEMIFISRNDANYKEKLEDLTSQGGKVTTYAINDSHSDEKNEITGFYNVEQIGRSR